MLKFKHLLHLDLAAVFKKVFQSCITTRQEIISSELKINVESSGKTVNNRLICAVFTLFFTAMVQWSDENDM